MDAIEVESVQPPASDTNERAPAKLPASDTELDVPVPLSFPSILRNPGIKDRYGHLYQPSTTFPTSPGRTVYKKTRRDDNEGKRWVRRKENAQFVGNPHIAAATKKDYMLQLKPIQATFPEPLPPYLPRSSKLPASLPPATDFNSANAGRFSLGLRGMRRDLRSAGSRAQHLVQAIEAELLCWLDAISVELNPDDARSIDYSTKHPIANIDSIFEVARTSHQLIWHIPEDAFARYVVHCCARFHNVVSFSKEISGSRLTFLLRPNVTRPNRQATAALDTPPTTDLDNSSRFDSDSELNCLVASDSSDAESIVSGNPGLGTGHNLSDIDERSLDGDSWSLVGDSEADADADFSAPEDPLDNNNTFNSLSVGSESDDPDRTFEAIPPLTFRHSLTRWQSHRSSSSPSRSPARARRRRPLRRDPFASKETKSLYAYLYT